MQHRVALKQILQLLRIAEMHDFLLHVNTLLLLLLLLSPSSYSWAKTLSLPPPQSPKCGCFPLMKQHRAKITTRAFPPTHFIYLFIFFGLWNQNPKIIHQMSNTQTAFMLPLSLFWQLAGRGNHLLTPTGWNSTAKVLPSSRCRRSAGLQGCLQQVLSWVSSQLHYPSNSKYRLTFHEPRATVWNFTFVSSFMCRTTQTLYTLFFTHLIFYNHTFRGETLQLHLSDNQKH